jgi:hypothetical protein
MKKTIKKLKKERDRRVKSISKKLLENNNLSGADKDLNWIRTVNELIDSAQTPPSWLWSFVIGLICLSTAGLAWIAPISLAGITPGVTCEVITDNVTFILNNDWSLSEPFAVNQLRVNGITSINSPGLEDISHVKISQEEPLCLEVKGKSIEVSELGISQRARIELGPASGQVQLFITLSSLKGTLNVSHASVAYETGHQSMTVTSGSSIPFVSESIPESITFTTRDQSAVPVRLSFESKEKKWHMSGFEVKKLGFFEEKKSGSGIFESAIHSGKVTILQSGAEYTLRESDRLILEDIEESKRLTVSRSQDNKVKVFFEGTVSKIKAGPEKFEKNLVPSLLEYVYHQQQIAFFCSASAFFWGMLWSVRNTIFR